MRYEVYKMSTHDWDVQTHIFGGRLEKLPCGSKPCLVCIMGSRKTYGRTAGREEGV
jgi:hypothetical protein